MTSIFTLRDNLLMQITGGTSGLKIRSEVVRYFSFTSCEKNNTVVINTFSAFY